MSFDSRALRANQNEARQAPVMRRTVIRAPRNSTGDAEYMPTDRAGEVFDGEVAHVMTTPNVSFMRGPDTELAVLGELSGITSKTKSAAENDALVRPVGVFTADLKEGKLASVQVSGNCMVKNPTRNIIPEGTPVTTMLPDAADLQRIYAGLTRERQNELRDRVVPILVEAEPTRPRDALKLLAKYQAGRGANKVNLNGVRGAIGVAFSIAQLSLTVALWVARTNAGVEAAIRLAVPGTTPEAIRAGAKAATAFAAAATPYDVLAGGPSVFSAWQEGDFVTLMRPGDLVKRYESLSAAAKGSMERIVQEYLAQTETLPATMTATQIADDGMPVTVNTMSEAVLAMARSDEESILGFASTSIGKNGGGVLLRK